MPVRFLAINSQHVLAYVLTLLPAHALPRAFQFGITLLCIFQAGDVYVLLLASLPPYILDIVGCNSKLLLPGDTQVLLVFWRVILQDFE